MPSPVEVLVSRLSLFLGQSAARGTVALCSRKTLGVAPDGLDAAQVQRLLPALRPMLTTLIGTGNTEAVLGQLAKEVAP